MVLGLWPRVILGFAFWIFSCDYLCAMGSCLHFSIDVHLLLCVFQVNLASLVFHCSLLSSFCLRVRYFTVYSFPVLFWQSCIFWRFFVSFCILDFAIFWTKKHVVSGPWSFFLHIVFLKSLVRVWLSFSEHLAKLNSPSWNLTKTNAIS